MTLTLEQLLDRRNLMFLREGFDLLARGKDLPNDPRDLLKDQTSLVREMKKSQPKR